MIPEFRTALEATSYSPFARVFLNRQLLKDLMSPSDFAESTGINTQCSDFCNFVVQEISHVGKKVFFLILIIKRDSEGNFALLPIILNLSPKLMEFLRNHHSQNVSIMNIITCTTRHDLLARRCCTRYRLIPMEFPSEVASDILHWISLLHSTSSHCQIRCC